MPKEIWLVWEVREEFCDQCGRRARRRLSQICGSEANAQSYMLRQPAGNVYLAERFDQAKGESWQINS
jgi:hypothetical protein